MVPGHVQGMSRVPPGRLEGGGGGEMDSGSLWWRANIQSAFARRLRRGRHPTTNLQPLSFLRQID
jgi:hypothetical protein